MADVIRLSSVQSFSSSSLLTSFKILHPIVLNQQSFKRVSSKLADSPPAALVSVPTPLSSKPRKLSPSFKVHAVIAEATDQPKWWEKNAGPNMLDIHSTEEFLSVLKEAGDRLVVVEFYGTWCASCRALFPRLCRMAEEHPEILFVKVNFDENKAMCKSMNVKVLPYFHFYRGVDGKVEHFSCSLAKFQKIKDAVETHNKARSSDSAEKAASDLAPDSSSNTEDQSAGSNKT